MNSIEFITPEGEVINFFVEEETRINGISYLLVTDSDGDEANAYILKDVSKDGDEEASYVLIEDDLEFDSVAALFKQIMDDVEWRND